MARVFETKNIEDDDSKIRIYACFTLKQLDELIEELNKIKSKQAKDNYIILQDEDDDDRFEIQIRFTETG